MPDLIAHAFYSIGYRPRESLVVVGLSGPRRQIGMTIRVDLPPTDRHRVPLESHVRVLREHGDDAVVVLVVSDRPAAGRPSRRPAAPPGAPPPAPPRQRLARDVRQRRAQEGFDVLDTLAVGDVAWRSYTCQDERCCPPTGHPMSVVESSAVAAWHVSQGEVLSPDEVSFLAYVDPEPLADAPPEGAVASSAAEPVGEPEPAHEALARWRALLAADGGDRPDGEVPPDVRWLVDALLDLRFRDALMLTLLPGSGTLPAEALLRGERALLDRLFDEPPDADLLARATALLAAVARTAPPGRRADALAVLAWAAWWAGDGTRGRLLAARATADRPSHTLAALIDQLLFVGIPPGWTRRQAG